MPHSTDDERDHPDELRHLRLLYSAYESGGPTGHDGGESESAVLEADQNFLTAANRRALALRVRCALLGFLSVNFVRVARRVGDLRARSGDHETVRSAYSASLPVEALARNCIQIVQDFSVGDIESLRALERGCMNAVDAIDTSRENGKLARYWGDRIIRGAFLSAATVFRQDASPDA